MRVLYDFSYKSKWYQAIFFYIAYSLLFFIIGVSIGFLDLVSPAFLKLFIASLVFIIGYRIVKEKKLEKKMDVFTLTLSTVLVYSSGFLIGLLFTAYLTTKENSINDNN